MVQRGRRVKWALGAITTLVLVLAASPVSATMMVALGMGELVARADEVFVGTVESQVARWDDRGRIVTDVTFRVQDRVKGSARVGGTLTIVRHGGAIGDLGMRIEGEPMFDDGDRALVFARRLSGARGVLRPVGMSQGVMPIEGAMVHPGGAGLALMQQVSTGALLPAPAALIAPRPLDAVLSEVRALAGGRRAP